MARGRRPLPAAVKEQKAPVRSRRKRDQVAAPVPSGGVTPPTWLKGDALGVWRRLAPTLASAKLLTQVDAETFGRYCRNFARWLRMQDALDGGTETYSVETASGVVHRPRPEFMIADRLERQLLAAEDRFGLSPAERQRIMAARAQSGISGDLFGGQERPAPPADDPAARPAKPASPARPVGSPVGLLN